MLRYSDHGLFKLASNSTIGIHIETPYVSSYKLAKLSYSTYRSVHSPSQLACKHLKRAQHSEIISPSISEISDATQFNGFTGQQTETLSELHGLMARTFWALVTNAGVNIIVLFDQFDKENSLQFTTQLTAVIVALSNCVLMDYSCKDFCKAKDLKEGQCGLPLVLQGIERLSLLFSNFSLIVTVLAIVQCMESAIIYPDVAIYVQVGLIAILVIRVFLLGQILNIQDKEIQEIRQDSPLVSVYDMDAIQKLPEWTPVVLGSYSLMNVLRKDEQQLLSTKQNSNNTILNQIQNPVVLNQNQSEVNLEYEFNPDEERILEVNMDDMFFAQISVSFLTISTLLLTVARYLEGFPSEAFSSGVDVFEHVGLAVALYGAQGSFQKVIKQQGKDVTYLMQGLSMDKGLGRFFETWAAVNFGVAVASFTQIGLFNGWLEVPFRKLLNVILL